MIDEPEFLCSWEAEEVDLSPFSRNGLPLDIKDDLIDSALSNRTESLSFIRFLLRFRARS